MDITFETPEENHAQRCGRITECCQSDCQLHTGEALKYFQTPNLVGTCIPLKHKVYNVDSIFVLGNDFLSSANKETPR